MLAGDEFMPQIITEHIQYKTFLVKSFNLSNIRISPVYLYLFRIAILIFSVF